MAQISRDFQLNLNLLKACREQMGLSEKQVKQTVNSISSIESGDKRPTYKQLDDLADLYQVPRWVFIADTLPEEYQYQNTPAFRKFKGTLVFEDAKVRRLIARVESYRDLLIELRQDMDEPIQKFSTPAMEDTLNINKTVLMARQWLSIEQPIDFSELKTRLEQKNIFVFLTSKYRGWSHVDKAFRGLSITHETMPLIIINDSDSKKAQAFTLMHELGHILRDDTAIDGEHTEDTAIEKWCDQFAGEALMPASSSVWQSLTDTELTDIDALARQFKVSTYACLVRLRQLQKIDQPTFNEREDQLKQQYEKERKKLQDSPGGPARNRSSEVKTQFGAPFIKTILNAWQSQEITLHKATKLLDLKRPQQFLELSDHL